MALSAMRLCASTSLPSSVRNASLSCRSLSSLVRAADCNLAKAARAEPSSLALDPASARNLISSSFCFINWASWLRCSSASAASFCSSWLRSTAMSSLVRVSASLRCLSWAPVLDSSGPVGVTLVSRSFMFPIEALLRSKRRWFKASTSARSALCCSSQRAFSWAIFASNASSAASRSFSRALSSATATSATALTCETASSSASPRVLWYSSACSRASFCSRTRARASLW
mmetsp:Transcript_5959/g.14084  ORF Transcript_5959/g.14084 Transcript_5959/m.14084 type:complete len:230 (+) Transcript_5959:128-817(+)